tara:strand:- start:232 stop:657 length:426 start_codon:yes stop_codon:yes gene_type:complete
MPIAKRAAPGHQRLDAVARRVHVAMAGNKIFERQEIPDALAEELADYLVRVGAETLRIKMQAGSSNKGLKVEYIWLTYNKVNPHGQVCFVKKDDRTTPEPVPLETALKKYMYVKPPRDRYTLCVAGLEAGCFSPASGLMHG